MRWHCWERDRAKGLFLQLQQRLHLLLYLVTPHSPARCQAAHGTGEPPHCTPARKRWESGTKTGRGRQRQWSWCHVGKGGDWISHLPEELGWTGKTGAASVCGLQHGPHGGDWLPHTQQPPSMGFNCL